MQRNRVVRTTLAMGALALALAGLSGCASATNSDVSYLGVIDAGSSGSRIHLYSIAGHTVSEVDLASSEIDTPLASFAAEPSQAGPAGIDPLLTDLDTFLNDTKVPASDITVSVMATAGMRKVAPDAATAIYASASSAITEAGFTLGTAETITGDQEALYTWTDANDLSGSWTSAAAHPVGIVEVGGASAQVAFAVSNATQAAELGASRVQLNGVNYNVFTHSYLGLGQNDARSSMLEAADARTACYPNGTDATVSFAASKTVSIPATTAQFDFAECDRLYQDVITQTATAFPLGQLAGISGFDQTDFLGLRSIAFAASDFNVTSTNAREQFQPAVTAVCTGANAWSKVLDLYGGKSSSFSQNACANGSYISTLLNDIAVSDQRFNASAEINGQSPSWTRGFAVLQAWKDN